MMDRTGPTPAVPGQQRAATVEQYVGIDVSLAMLSVCGMDRRDGGGLTQRLWLGWFRPLQSNLTSAREVRDLRVAREQLQK